MLKAVTLKGLKFSLLVLFTFFVQSSFSQFKARIHLKNIGEKHLSDSIFIAGNFNNWSPADADFRLTIKEKEAFIDFDDVAAGKYEFKFTRGNWLKVISNADGSDVANYVIDLSSDTNLIFSIAGWKDEFILKSPMHTNSPNVQLLDSAFAMPELNTTRRIWLYLPPGYKTSKNSYPVIYMHDGQNIFDTQTSGFGEWGVDETIDSLVKKGHSGSIVVGIDNGPERMMEYNPFEYKAVGMGKGDKYVDFIVNTLKPFIDKQYRTLTLKNNTIIAGSSMGGLISYYAMLKYPEVFGKAGIFSPAFFTAGQIKELTGNNGNLLKGKLFFYMGGLEGGTYVEDMNQVTELLGKNSSALIYSVIDPEGHHNEAAWRKWFPEFYSWIMAEGFNKVMPLDQ